MKDYHQKGCSFTSLVIDAPPASGLILPTTTLVGENTKKIVKKIWEDLMGDKVTKIGVWGMGGIGKTTIMRHINNRLQEETNEFNDVIWVTVSQPLDLIKLQTEIATALKLSLTEDEDKVRLTERLLGKLKAKKKFVLILDDMWEAFPLEEVGIPEPNKQNGCKLMITTRSVGVCHSMGCEEVKVQPLSKEEALNLFLDKVGRNILHVPTLSKEIINSVVEECAGLPLAIVIVAGCMRGVYEIHEWRNALNELRGLVRSFNRSSIASCIVHLTVLCSWCKLAYIYRDFQRIPECFFAHMHGLKILNLSYTDIEVLPNSISDLTNLRWLLLRYCRRLERVPSLAKLLALQCLDLEYTTIKEVPEDVKSSDGQRSKNFHFQMSTVYNVLSRILDFIASFAQAKQMNQCASMGAKSVKEKVLPLCSQKMFKGLIMRDIKDVTSLNDVLSKERGLVTAVSDNAVLICNSLQEIQITPSCPKLKRLSLRLPPLDNGQPSPSPALEVIKIRKELWESLEWDQANAKEVLNPYSCSVLQDNISGHSNCQSWFKNKSFL
ncbi:Disease resistance protein SUMM2 [Citrus sinensis]|uniref:Disease resistance protein SUMM2 n=1 Tax=Citrus sinensis TaxID=2711 RepID=A0ACB8JE82_CITSI|nr:Disease resistance protein SUMM2 [Citrus sinensis]